jgi:hypothetical protein
VQRGEGGIQHIREATGRRHLIKECNSREKTSEMCTAIGKKRQRNSRFSIVPLVSLCSTCQREKV